MENQIIEVPYHMIHGYGGGEGFLFPGGEAAASWCLPSVPHHNQVLQDEGYMYSCSIPPPPPLVPPLYRDLCTRRPAAAALQFPYDGGITNVGSAVDSAGLLAATAAGSMGLERFPRLDGSASSSLFGTIHAELGKMTAQQIMDAKALAASKSHSEAERRRRERINGHLARLRSMLPNTTKTDKASLLAEVIQHVKELKRQTSEIAEESPLPTEADEILVSSACDEEGKLVVRASLCCEDRADLLPDLIKALKALRLRVLKAEITTVGGRVKSVLLIAGEQHSSDDDQHRSMTAIQEALKAVVEQTAKNDLTSVGGTKRQRTSSLNSVQVEQTVHLA